MRPTIVLIITGAFFLLHLPASSAQTVRELPPKAYELYPTLQDMYGYAIGKHKDYLLIFGGRVKNEDTGPDAEGFPNLDILMIDFNKSRAAAYTSGNLEGFLYEQASSYGMAYYQEGTTLYLIGGYGFSETSGQFITFPFLTAIELEKAIAALLAGKSPEAHFYQICDDRMAIFDGVLDSNGDEYFLINGRYAYKLSPFSKKPEYFEESLRGQARTFRLKNEGRYLEIGDYKSWYSLENLQEAYGPLLPGDIQEELKKMGLGISQ